MLNSLQSLGNSVFEQMTNASSNVPNNSDLTAAEQATQMAREIINGLWEQVGNSEIYTGILAVAKIFLGIGLLIVLYRTYMRVTENRMDYRAVIASFTWPLIAIVLLVEPPNLQGQIVTSNTNMWQISLTLRNVVNTLNDVAITGLGTKNGKSPIDLFAENVNASSAIWEQSNACTTVPQDLQLACLESLPQQLENMKNNGTPVSFAYTELGQNLAQIIASDGEQQQDSPLRTLAPDEYAKVMSNPLVSMGRNLIEPIINKLLLGLYLMFSLLIEISMLLVAILAPIALGMSLIPLQSNSLVAFLSGFTSIGMTKIAFNVIANLGANFSFDTNYSGFNTAVCLLLGVGAPFIAGSVGAFSASAVYQGVSYVGMLAASLGAGTIGRVGFLGAAAMRR